MTIEAIMTALGSLSAPSLIIGALLVFVSSRFRLVMTFVTNLVLAWKGRDTKPLPKNGNGGNYISREEFTSVMDRHIKSEAAVGKQVLSLTETVGKIDGKLDIIGKQVAALAKNSK